MSKPEEVLGMIQGLADALKSSHDNQKATQHQIEALAKTVHELASAEKPTKSIAHDGQALRLPPVTLPVFKGDPQERLERFLDHFVSIIYTSNISPCYYVQYLKQQCQSDLRTFDIITNAETEHFAKLIKDPAKASPDDYKAYFEVVKQTLLQKRGTPKEQQIRELLSEYYSMQQGTDEKVCDFAHRFIDIQTELSKLIPGVHLTSDGNDIELQYAFTIKLRKAVQVEIISREFSYSSLQAVIG